MLCTDLDLPHPLAIGFIQCICDYGLNLVGTHLFHCSHGEEQITSHNDFRDAFAFIMKDAGFHVLREQIHALPLPYFEYFHWQINIMLLIDCIRTLIDVVIVDPT